MLKRVAIVESVRTHKGVTTIICDDIFTSKNHLQKYLDLLSQYGDIKFTDYDDNTIDVKTLWKGDDMDFGFIKYTENSVEFMYRVRMKRINRYV